MKKNIFYQMLLIFLIPALGMLFFTGVFVKEKVSILNDMDIEKSSIEYLMFSEELLNNLQKERGLSAAFIASRGNSFHKELIEQRKLSDNILEKYKNYILSNDIKNTQLVNQIKTIQTGLFKLNGYRTAVDGFKINVYHNIENYTKLNNEIIDGISILASNDFSKKTFQNITAIVNLIKTKDLAGIERASLTNYFITKELCEPFMYDYIKSIIDTEDKNIKRFIKQTSIENTELYYRTLSSEILDKIAYYQEIFIKNSLQSKIDNVDHKEWWDISTQKLEAYGKLIRNISNKTKNGAQDSLLSAKQSLIFSLVFWLIGMLGFALSIFLLKNIIRSENKSYKNLVKQKQLYNVLSKTNELIIHDYSMDEVFQNVCDIAVNEVDLSLAFIGMLDSEGDIKIVASTGKQQLQDYLLKLHLSTRHDRGNTLGLAGKAIVEARNIIIDNVREDKTSLLLDFAKEHQLNSAAAYPLVQSNTIVGVMVIYSKDIKFFDTDIAELFERMSGYLSFGLDRGAQKRLHRLYEEELRISAYAFDSQEAMVITDKEGNIVKVNNAFSKITGYTRNEVIGKNPRVLKSDVHDSEFFKDLWHELSTRGRWTGEIYNKHKNGKVYPQKTTITAIKDKNNITTHYIGQFYDISDIKMSEERLLYQARHDALTGLPNRVILNDRLDLAIKSAKRHAHIGALMFIDLDNFKTINDTLGHNIGDELLKHVADILSSCIREEDTVVRFGGDEFLILTSNLSKDIDEAKAQMDVMANKIKDKIDVPLYIDNNKLMTTPSIGITFFPTFSIDINDLIKQADIAMYKAKDAGKNSIEFYTP